MRDPPPVWSREFFGLLEQEFDLGIKNKAVQMMATEIKNENLLPQSFVFR